MKKFPKIVQYRQFIKSQILRQQYAGKDEDDRPIYDADKSLKPVKVSGRVKLHGSNAGLRVNFKDKTWQAQSRERILSEGSDNAGFHQFINSISYDLIDRLAVDLHFLGVDELIIFGEWCGGSIQKGVALNKLDKMFVVFGLKVLKGQDWQWLSPVCVPEYPELKIYNVNRAGSWDIEIDLNRPELAVEQMVKWTEEVEKECPFCKTFGVEGVGEGIVFSQNFDFDFAFKSKGEAHSKSKVKKLPTVDVEKLNSINEFVEKNLTEERLQQAWDHLSQDGEIEDLTKLGDFIRWLNNDIWEEESDEALANNIERKDIGKPISSVAVKWFKNKLYE